MKGACRRGLLPAAVLAVLGLGDCAGPGRDAAISASVEAQRPPVLDPDYAGAVVPPNLAPLNFAVAEPGTEYRVAIRASRGKSLELSSRTPGIAIPPEFWRELLQANRGDSLYFEVWVRDPARGWIHFQPVANRIAPEPIDGYLVYRRLKPLYNKYLNIGIYQRHLETYEESAVLENRDADRACLNCHTFARQRPDPMLLHTRSRHGLTMLIARDGKVAAVDTRTAFNPSPAAYSSWHPGGKLIAFSVNKLSLFFHTTGETRDVFDAASDLALYRIDANELTTAPAISRPDSLETWPSWSPDGRYLYFCRAPQLPIERFREVRYDLMRIPYDLERGEWGQPETVLAAGRTGLSIAQPRVSPDGRYLLFCMAEYGNFPVFQASSDLYLMDLETGQYRRLSIDSERTDSWHSWSSNGRWIVFSSKRRDGLFTRLYLSYFDPEGEFHKPVLLPQCDPAFYDSFVENYNVPELVSGPVEIGRRDLARAVYAPDPLLKPGLDPAVPLRPAESGEGAREPYSPGVAR
jgi:hypothetical protein